MTASDKPAVLPTESPYTPPATASGPGTQPELTASLNLSAYRSREYGRWLASLEPGIPVALVERRLPLTAAALPLSAEIWLVGPVMRDLILLGKLESYSTGSYWRAPVFVPIQGPNRGIPRNSWVRRASNWTRRRCWRVEPASEKLREWAERQKTAQELAGLSQEDWAALMTLSQIRGLAEPALRRARERLEARPD